MKIGIDASLVVGEKAGVGFYTASLIEALAAIDTNNQYVLYPFFYYIFHPEFKQFAAPPASNFSVRFRHWPEWWVRYLWFHSPIPRHHLLGNVDVLHSTTFCSPRRHPGRLVVTIYDVSFLRYPEHHTEPNRIHCLRGTLEAALWADRIIAISHSTRRDLIEYLNIPADRIAVVHGAARKEFHPRSPDAAKARVEELWGLSQPYILTVGTLEPRKNTRRLIRAYGALPSDVRDEFRLVIAGGSGWLTSDIYQWAVETGLESRITFLGYVPDEHLPWLYSGSTCFVYPSLYEGFGLPPLEAMASGVPVIAGDTSSIPEVVGDSGILVDPLSESDLSASMFRILTDSQLSLELGDQGVRRAEGFSWEKAARETLAVYGSLGA